MQDRSGGAWSPVAGAISRRLLEVQRRAERGIPPLGGISAKMLAWRSRRSPASTASAGRSPGRALPNDTGPRRTCWSAATAPGHATTGMPGGSSSSPAGPPRTRQPGRGPGSAHLRRSALRRVARAARGSVLIPYGRDIVGYLRLPHTPRPAPLVFGIAGLDSRKEDIAARMDAYIKRGIGIFAVDLPGTGESPVAAAAPDSDRIFSAALDYFAARPDVNAKRMVVQGRSWSGIGSPSSPQPNAIDCAERSCTADRSITIFNRIGWRLPGNWRISLRLSGGEMRDARGVGPGRSARPRPRLSLLDAGLLDQPSAPTLIVNGARDAVLIADAILLLERGTAKDAWINPQGGHMGRSPEWPVVIAEKILMPWIARRLASDTG